MLNKPASRSVYAPILRKASDFKSDEEGGVTIFVVLLFVLMIMFGGIAVDVMRFEWRRVTLQETMDRAMLAAANVAIPPDQSPQSVAESWFDVAGLGDELTVDFSTPVITGVATNSSRSVVGTARVRSYNHFMHLMDYPWFEAPVASGAQQGVSKIEVIMVLDITGSMGESSGSTTKIAALRRAATNFVEILKFNRDASGNITTTKDPNNLISIGMVPYSSNVNIPAELRNQFTVSHLSHWDGIANQGVPGINCFEIPESTYGATGLSRSDAIPMQAVAHTGASNPGVSVTNPGTNNTNGRNGGVVNRSYSAPAEPSKNTTSYTCNDGQNYSTATDEAGSNLVALPTTDISALKTQISQLNPRGTTSIAVGMRWGTALIDQSARPIYTALRGAVPGMIGRPADNNDGETRKIIVLMTDGTHVASRYIYDDYKTGLSPIFRGGDGRMAIRFDDSGVGLVGGLRPGLTPGSGTGQNSCSGWSLADTVVNGNVVKRNFFVPHLKANSVRLRANATEPEGQGTGSNVTGGCDPRAWLSSPEWSGSGGPAQQLDWSEVWRYASVDWVIEQLYMRSNVSSATNYNTVYNTFVGNYLDGTSNMDNLLNTNCNAAKSAGIEVFGIVLGDNVTEGPVRNCSSPGTGYYYRVTNADNLNAAFEQIAVLISPLRLTQ